MGNEVFLQLQRPSSAAGLPERRRRGGKTVGWSDGMDSSRCFARHLSAKLDVWIMQLTTEGVRDGMYADCGGHGKARVRGGGSRCWRQGGAAPAAGACAVCRVRGHAGQGALRAGSLRRRPALGAGDAALRARGEIAAGAVRLCLPAKKQDRPRRLPGAAGSGAQSRAVAGAGQDRRRPGDPGAAPAAQAPGWAHAPRASTPCVACSGSLG